MFWNLDTTTLALSILSALPHSDVPPALATNINSGSYRGAESPQDVICFVKKYISSSELAQDPLLVMTEGRGANFNLVPATKMLFFCWQHFGFLKRLCINNININIHYQSMWVIFEVPNSYTTRKGNNFTPALGAKWKELSQAVAYCYGEKYGKAVDYLNKMSTNWFWENGLLKPLPWHSGPPAQGNAHAAPLVLHPAVLNSLAPAMPLKAVFGGNRHRWQHGKTEPVGSGLRKTTIK